MGLVYTYSYEHPSHPGVELSLISSYEYDTNVQTGPATYSHANPWSENPMEDAIVKKLNLQEVVKWKMIRINERHC